MAKEDYDVILFKTLTYLYACKKRKTVFSKQGFNRAIGQGVNSSWLRDILQMAQDEELIDGLIFAKVWENEIILANELNCMTITHAGILYLKENSNMQKIKNELIQIVDPINGLIRLIM